MEKYRLDNILALKGITSSVSKAQALIMTGKVLVNEKKVEKPGTKFSQNISIRIIKKEHDWVSRGGVKLSHALKSFNYYPDNKICADIGASTGGFTEVLVKNNAKLVYAIDVGQGQLNWSLYKNSKVKVLDKTNIRNIFLNDIDSRINFITCDLSFISITKALLNIVQENNNKLSIMALIKPQFELNKSQIGKNGIVVNECFRKSSIENVCNWFKSFNWKVSKPIQSPIKGAKGNTEYFILCKNF